jgi:hypothetical protein
LDGHSRHRIRSSFLRYDVSRDGGESARFTLRSCYVSVYLDLAVSFCLSMLISSRFAAVVVAVVGNVGQTAYAGSGSQ